MSYQATGWVLEFSESTLGARLVLQSIAYHLNNDTGIAYPSLETISRECRMTKPGVIQALERLEQSGELTRDRTKGGGSGNVNRYSMPMFLEWWAEARQIKGKKGKPYYGNGQPDAAERVNVIAENSKAYLPEPEVEPSLEQKENNAASACPECGARQDLCMGHTKGKKKIKSQPEPRFYRKEGYVEAQPSRSKAEERAERTRKALEVFDHPERLPEHLRRAIQTGRDRRNDRSV